MNTLLPEHGGPDALGRARFDFSTNANPLAAPGLIWEALLQADRRHYPDPAYHQLREVLGGWHAADPARILPCAGGSEAIRRISLAGAICGLRQVWLPEPGYADYHAAAQALQLPVQGWLTPEQLLDGLGQADSPPLVWLTEPANPSGASLPGAFWPELLDAAERCGAWVVLDRAYEPLRLVGADPLPPALAQRCWQVFSPNKALGLTGVRAGWILAPQTPPAAPLATLHALAPSWVLATEGEALLRAYARPEVAAWLEHSRRTLRQWRQQQQTALAGLGWQQEDGLSVTPFWLARPPGEAGQLAGRLARLRQADIKLRDARSFGRPGWVRIATQTPQALAALLTAWPSCATAEASAVDRLDDLSDRSAPPPPDAVAPPASRRTRPKLDPDTVARTAPRVRRRPA